MTEASSARSAGSSRAAPERSARIDLAERLILTEAAEEEDVAPVWAAASSGTNAPDQITPGLRSLPPFGVPLGVLEEEEEELKEELLPRRCRGTGEPGRYVAEPPVPDEEERERARERSIVRFIDL